MKFDKNHQAILDSVDNFTDEELREIVKKVKAKNLGGPTIEEYFNQFNKTPLMPSQLKKGMRVVDSSGTKGVIEECSDMHNVFIKTPRGGGGYVCYKKGCNFFDGYVLCELKKTFELKKTSKGNYFGYIKGFYYSAYKKSHGGWACAIGRKGKWLFSEGMLAASLKTKSDIKKYIFNILY